ncbi:MAG: polyprenyl synthetase family protein [Casimicrobiaceae bacterium]|nr:polyprenyl synthetase family protein [Casimicrobiaceae bacterium]
MAQHLPTGELPAGRLLEAMRYGALGGGKRLRALLAYASAEAVDCAIELADHAAVAVELIHAYSLIHDDLPCMDNDALRRGKPTAHIVFGEATAMLAGDAMQPLAFAVLAEMPARAEGRVAAIAELARASGALGMAGGQAIDLACVGQSLTLEALEAMHRLKTGAIFEAAVVLPALACEVEGSTLETLRAFARPLGLAFQVIDDVLDATADTATLGKTAGKDAKDDKPTFVSLLGVEEARAYAARLTEQCLEALEPLVATRPRAQRLATLARAMGARTH